MSWLNIPPDIIVQEIEDELVLLNLTNERYHALNATGRRFLQLAQASESFEVAVDQIIGEFSISRELAAGDLTRMLSELEDRSLVSVER